MGRAVGIGLAVVGAATWVWSAETPVMVQQAYLKADVADASDQFGDAIAVDADTVVVGATLEDGSGVGPGAAHNNLAPAAGAAYVYVRSGGAWMLQAVLKASNTGTNDRFGVSVAVSGDTIVVGAPGEASASTGVNGNETSNTASSSGAAYVFVRNGGTWTQQAYLKASNTNASDAYGASVAIEGDLIAVGASDEDGGSAGVNGDQSSNTLSNSGAVYVYTRTGTVWEQEAYLKASNPGSADLFGGSVALSNGTLVVGAEFEDSAATTVNGNGADNSAINAGAAYVFVRDAGTWTQQAYLKGHNTSAGLANFGRRVDIDGDRIIVGAHQEDTGATNSGAAYVFRRELGVWTQEAFLKANNAQASDAFGVSVGISGTNVVIGANLEDGGAVGINGAVNEGANGSGAAYVYVFDAGAWTHLAYVKASNTNATDNFGVAAAISAGRVVVSANLEDSIAVGVDGDQSNNLASSSGAAYVFAITGMNQVPVADAGADLVVEATEPAGAQVSLTAAGSSDPDGDLLSFAWRNSSGDTIATTRNTTQTLPLGTHTFSVLVDDGNGGVDDDEVVVVVQDTVAPVITLTSPQNVSYAFGAPVLAQFTCADAASGVATCVGSVPSGSAINTTVGGAFLFTVTATDAAGNGSSLSVGYSVVEPCAAGSYRAAPTDLACTPAPAGSYVPVSGATSALLCPAGSFSALPGSVECTPAPVNFYVPTPGAVAATACPIGMTAPGGATACTDTIAPTIVGVPASFFLPATSSSGATVSYTLPTATDLVDGPVPVGCSPSSGSTRPTGETTVTCSAADGAGNSTSANFVVTVGVWCSAGSYLATPTASTCTPAPPGSYVPTDGASASLLCPAGRFSATEGAAVCTLAPANFYVPEPGATAAIACPAGTSSAPGASVCVDTVPPTISNVPADFLVPATSAAGATVTFTTPTATDLIDGPVTVTCAPASGATRPSGPTTVMCSATDSVGNVAQAQFIVTVGLWCSAGSYLSAPAATSCTPAPPGSYVPAAGSSEPTLCPAGSFSPLPGSSSCNLAPEGYFVADEGATAPTACPAGTTSTIGATECDDTIAPVISNVPVSVHATATSSAGAVVTFTTPTAEDLVDGPIEVVCTPASGSTLSSGSHTVRCTATDAAGNRISATFPVIVGPWCTAGAYLATPTATTCTPAPAGSFVSGDGATEPQLCAAGSFSALPGATLCTLAPANSYVPTPGATEAIACPAGTTSAAGATACTDTIAPTISNVPAAITAAATSSAGAAVTYTLPTATDLVDGPLAVACTPVSGGTFPTGATTVNCSAADAAGNSASASFTVTVGLWCTAGNYLATPNASACTPAPAGSFVPTDGASAAQLCPAGSFSALPGAMACTPAPANSYVPAPGATEAIACPAGTTSAAGATACTDTIAPTISNLPAPITAAATSSAGAAVTYTLPAATDLVDGPLAVACTPASGATFPTGATTVNCTAADAAGNSASASFTVTVGLWCTAGNYLATPNASSCTPAPAGSFVPTDGASAAQLCPAGSFSALPGAMACTPALANSYVPTPGATEAIACPAGTTSAAGATACTDTIAPTISNVPAPITAAATSSAGAPVTYTLPTATDLVDGPLAVACTPASGGTFPTGATTVNCTAADAAGNSASASFTVTVGLWCTAGNYLATPNASSCTPAPAGSFVPTDGASGARLCPAGSFSALPGATACTLAPANSYVPTPGATEATACPAGTTSAVGATACTDTIAPTISNVPAPITAAATSSAGAAVAYTLPTATDLVDGPLAVACTPASGGTFPTGATTVNCTAVDAAGNSASASFTVTVGLWCTAGNFLAAPNASSCTPAPAGSYVSTDGASAAQLCPAGSFSALPGATACTPAPTNSYVPGPGGTEATACPAGTTSPAGATACTDTIAPTISNVPAPITAAATSSAGAVVTYTLPTATDLVDGPLAVACTPASGGTFPTGATTVNCTAADAAGNSASASFTVTVGLWCTAGNYLATPNASSCTAAPAGSFVPTDGASAAQQCPAGSFSAVPGSTACTLAPANTYVPTPGATEAIACPAGTTSPAGATACTDTIAPTISNVPAPITAAATSSAGAVVTYTLPTATDLVDGPLAVACTPASGGTFPTGATTVNCTAADAAGNSASASFTVTVGLWCTAGNYLATPNASSCTPAPAGSFVPTDGASGAQLCPAGSFSAVPGSTACTLAPANTYVPTPGATEAIACPAGTTSAAGATACTDTIAPTISNVPAPITAAATSSAGAAVTYTLPTATDLVDGPLAVACTPASGATFPTGATTVNCTAADAAGNSASASFTVTVGLWCTAGSYLATPNASSCTAAPAGSFVPTDGASAAQECPAGSFSALPGSTACTLAPANSYVPASGATEAIACPAGTTSAAGATACTDTIAPTISNVPAAITAAATSSAGASVTYTLPTATDLVDGPLAVACTPASGGMFPTGATTVNCTAADAAGNSASASFTVTVGLWCTAGNYLATPNASSCTPAPAGSYVPTDGASAAQQCPAGSFSAVPGATACTLAPANSYVPASGATEAIACPAGTTSAAGATACTDTIAPTISNVPAAITAAATSSAGAAVTYTLPTATDLVDGPLAVACAPASGGTFPTGATTVNCTAADAAGNSASASFTVTVGLWCTAGNYLATPNASACTPAPAGSFVPTDGANAAQLCPAGSFSALPGATACTLAPANSYVPTPGATEAIACPAGTTSPAGATACTDTIAPTISNVPAPITAAATSSAGAPVTYTLPTATDVVDGPVAVSCAPTSGGTFPTGATTVNCTAADAAGNSASASFTVTVGLWCTAGNYLATPNASSCTPAPAGSFVPTDGASAAQLCPAGSFSPTTGATACTLAPANSYVPAPGATEAIACPAGTTSAAGATVCTDTIAPTISNVPAAITAAATSSAGAAVTYTLPTATDLVDGPLAVACTPASGGTFPTGATTVNCTAADAAGNSASASFTVTVGLWCTAGNYLATPNASSCTPAPAGSYVPTDGASAAQQCPAGSFSALPGATACTLAPANSYVPTPGATAATPCPTGTTSQAGATQCTDTVAPTLSGLTNVTTAATDATGATVTYVQPTATDNRDGSVPVTCSPASGSRFVVGTSTVTCTARDAAGNVGTGTFTVTVTAAPDDEEDEGQPGDMRGDGFIREDGARYRFQFRYREDARGNERGQLSVEIHYDPVTSRDNRGRSRTTRREDDKFQATSLTSLVFSDDPTVRPRRLPWWLNWWRPRVDTVVASGTGKWNGRSGYTYELIAVDNGEPGRHRETLTLVIKNSAGQVMAQVSGDIDGGYIHSRRIH